MADTYRSALDGWDYVANPGGLPFTSAAFPNVGPRTAQKHAFPAQAGNTAALNTANQAIGTIAAPALLAGAQGTVTWTNNQINSNSIIRVVGVRIGTTSPAVGAFCFVADWQAPGAGSVVLDVFNPGSAATLSTDYQIVVEVLATAAG